MANAILVTDDDVIICDPEGEYGNLVRQFNGEVIKVSSKSKDYLNPLDINMNYDDGDAPLKDKANFIMSMLELVVGGSGLTAEEKSVIDRCLPKIYEKYFENPEPCNMPILQDLYDMLKEQEEKVGKKLATEMEIYGMYQKVGTEINIIKEKTFDKAIPKIIREAREFINTQLRDFQYLDKDGKFKIMPEYPEFAWFEGIVNALTHRNYAIRGEHIKVLIFDDRLEILSPGLLPNIVTIENILNQRYSRNPRIARTLCEFGWVKEMNEGVKRIYSEMEKLFLKKPKYAEPNSSVLLVLENNILNRSIRTIDSIKGKISEEVFDTLSQDEKTVIHFMYNSGQKITTKMATELIEKGSTFCRKLLKNLADKDLLEWHGTSQNDRTQYYTLKF